MIFDDRRFGMISVKDRRLLQEALDWHCDAFMTMERRLPTADRAAGDESDDLLGTVGPLGGPVLIDR
jgi:hypothetical protein